MAATPTDTRPVRPTGPPVRRRAPVWLAATVTTVWAALVSWVPVVLLAGLVAQTAGGPSMADRLRFGTAFWLLGHGVPLVLGGDRLTLVPLGVSVLAAWRVFRAGVHTARAIGARTPGRALLAAGSVGLAYAGLGALAANAVAPLATPLSGAVRLGAFGVVLAGLGAAVESRTAGRLAARVPLPVRDALRTGTVAALLVLAAGGAVAGVALAVSGGQAAATLATFHAGVLGQSGLTLLCLVYAPVLATWSGAYLIGPGFAVGTGTVVSAGKVSLGALPAIPVLAALPDSAVSGLGPLLLGLPLAAGMAAGWLLARRRLRLAADREGPPSGWAELLGAAALSGLCGGLLLAAASAVSSGGLGSGRLAELGPVWWTVGAVSAGVLAVGAVVGAAATKAVGRTGQ